MVLKKMKVPKLVDDWEERNNVIILNVSTSDQRLQHLQQQAKKIANFNADENRKSTFYMDSIINPNLKPIQVTSMECKMIKMLSNGLPIKTIAKRLGTTFGLVKGFKQRKRIIEKRCIFYDADGWMVLKDEGLSGMYKSLVKMGLVNECLSSFLAHLDEHDGALIFNGKLVGKIVTLKMIRRSVNRY